MKTASAVDVLIENISTDQKLLEEVDTKIQEAKDEKKEITDRLKDYRRDASVLLKYADEAQRAKIEELGFDFSEQEQGLNPVASIVMELLMKAKGNQMTNGELYEAYVKTFAKEEDAYSYTEFNIKCRSLFNTQRLLRKKGANAKSSREDIISVNGRVIPKQEKKEKDEA